MVKKFLPIILILLFALFLRLFAIKQNHFYFTMDQGRDAIMVRQILHGKFILEGPVTSIKDFYQGPLWYYFLALGFVLTAYHPVGGVIILIMLNLFLIGLVMLVIKKQISLKTSLTAGFGLAVLPSFFATSWYSFNPHWLPFICTSLVIFLALVNKKQAIYYFLSAIVLGLVLHSEIAFVIPVFLLFLGVGLYSLIYKKISLSTFLYSLLIFLSFLLPHLLSEILNNFSQTKAVILELRSPQSIIGKVNYFTNFKDVVRQILLITSQSFLGIKNLYSGLLFISLALIFIILKRQKKAYDFSFKFILFTLIIWSTTIFWFSFNKKIASWYFVGLGPIVFISFLLMLNQLKKLGFYISLVCILIHFFILINNESYFKKTADQSILANELKTINWVYQQSRGEAFKVYTFLPSVYDYPYQYLFPWYGKKQYGYLPQEYTTYPNISASTYVADSQKYQEKNQLNTNLFFLIIEPPVEQVVLDEWYKGVSKDSQLIEVTKVGNITLEKRQKR